MKRLMGALQTAVLAGGLALPALAQTTDPGTDPAAPSTTAPGMPYGTPDHDRDDDFDYGWLGLVGLAGLMGLMRKRPDRTDTIRDTGLDRR